jgi:hypothetical protein
MRPQYPIKCAYVERTSVSPCPQRMNHDTDMAAKSAAMQGLTLVHFSAQRKRICVA